MFRNEKLEMKVGLFIGAGIFLMFLIVFSISDFYLLEKGYSVKVIFDYVNGITENAPIRLAGVHVGDVKDIKIYYDDAAGKTKVDLNIWVNDDIKIERDAVARINTLGLLGEQYLEITPGMTREFLEPGGVLVGENPVNVGREMQNVSELITSIKDTFQHISKGEGTIGKFVSDNAVYDDLATILGRLSKGEGTIGKLLVEEKIYDDLEAFVADIKAHPWKLLSKPSRSEEASTTKKGTSVKTR